MLRWSLGRSTIEEARRKKGARSLSTLERIGAVSLIVIGLTS
jgi:hypothetical protein